MDIDFLNDLVDVQDLIKIFSKGDVRIFGGIKALVSDLSSHSLISFDHVNSTKSENVDKIKEISSTDVLVQPHPTLKTENDLPKLIQNFECECSAINDLNDIIGNDGFASNDNYNIFDTPFSDHSCPINNSKDDSFDILGDIIPQATLYPNKILKNSSMPLNDSLSQFEALEYIVKTDDICGKLTDDKMSDEIIFNNNSKANESASSQSNLLSPIPKCQKQTLASNVSDSINAKQKLTQANVCQSIKKVCPGSKTKSQIPINLKFSRLRSPLKICTNSLSSEKNNSAIKTNLGVKQAATSNSATKSRLPVLKTRLPKFKP